MNHYFTLLFVLAVHLTGPYLAALVSLGLVIFVGNLFFVKWAMKQMRVEPGEEAEAEGTTGASNAIGDTPIRATVGVPRNRSLRPRDPAMERASSADETVVPRKDYAGTLASANPSNEASKGGGRAGFEPLMPYSPGAEAAASANPLPASSRTTESEPAGSLIALAAAPAPATVAPRGADSLSLPPLSAGESKQVESKQPEPAKPTPAAVEPPLSGTPPKADVAEAATVTPVPTRSEASADLILVDKNAPKEDAKPQPPSFVETVIAPVSKADVPKLADVASQESSDAKFAPTNIPASASAPEAESNLTPLTLPPLEPLVLDIDSDEVKKSKSRQASTSAPEGALIAPAIETPPVAVAKPAEQTASPEMTGLILPVLVPAQEIEPEKKSTQSKSTAKTAETESLAKATEPAPVPASVLPPLELTPSLVAEEPPKPVTRSRVFLPAALEETAPAKPPVAEIVPPVEAPSPEIPPVASTDTAPPVQIGEAEEEKHPATPVEQVPSSAPLSAVELPTDVPASAVVQQPTSESESAVHPVVHVEQERQEILQGIAQEVAPTGRKIFMPQHAEIAAEADEKPAVSVDEPTATPVPTPPLGGLTAIESPESKTEPEAHATPPVLPELVEDTGHLTAKVSEPEVSEQPSVEAPTTPTAEHEAELPLLVNELEKAHESDHPEVASEKPVEEATPVTTPIAEEPEEVHAEVIPHAEPVKHEDVHLATPSDFGLSPVDAEHIHGATSETESVRDDSPHDLPIQLAPAEPVEEPRVVEHHLEETSQPPIEQKEPAHESETPVEEKPVLSETVEPTPIAVVQQEAPVSLSENLTTLPSQPAVAPVEDASITTPRSHMTSTESTSSQPATGRASAQLTLGFEVTALQLTPFFKLGAVQLRPLSNIVSLHLLTAQQAENPLAAGISFQIETVDLDEHAHIRSILLKPLPQAQAAATPQPKLQVDNVQLGQTTEGAPIQVTSSQGTSTAVQLLATCTIAAMDFTPAFEIGSLRLEPNSNFVLLRSAPSQRPAALDLPPSFEVANVQLEGQAQIASVRLTPSTGK